MREAALIETARSPTVDSRVDGTSHNLHLVANLYSLIRPVATTAAIYLCREKSMPSWQNNKQIN